MGVQINRRQFLKTIAATAAGMTAAVVAPSVGKERTGWENDVAIKFWMQTYGPKYAPLDIDWEKVDTTLCGIYSGMTVLNIKASNYQLGDRLVLNDGRRYRCTALYEGFYKKNDGIYYK